MKHTKLVLALAAAGVLVVGCGGGGSSSSAPAGGGTATTSLTGSTKYGAVPTAAIKITATNAPSVVSGANTSMNGLNNLSSAATIKAAGASKNSAVSIAQREVMRMQNTQFKSLPIGVVGTNPTTTPCTGPTGGTYTSSFKDKNGNGTFDAGDAYSISFNACDDGQGTVQTGVLSMSITTLPSATSQNFAATLSFADLKSVTAATATTAADTTNIDGDLSMSSITAASGSTTMTISGKLLAMNSTLDGVFQMADYSLAMTNSPAGAFSIDITMTTAGTVMNGSVTLTTPTPLTGGTGGSMRITGAGGSYVQVSAADATGTNCNLTVFDGTTTTNTTPTCASLSI